MKGYFMEKLWLPIGGMFIQMDLIISLEAHQVDLILAPYS